jgi:hypothetical protein
MLMNMGGRLTRNCEGVKKAVVLLQSLEPSGLTDQGHVLFLLYISPAISSLAGFICSCLENQRKP